MSIVIGNSINRAVLMTDTEFFAGSVNCVAYVVRPTTQRGLFLSGFRANVHLPFIGDEDPGNRMSVYLFENLVFPSSFVTGGPFADLVEGHQRLLTYDEYFAVNSGRLRDIFIPPFRLHSGTDYSLVLSFGRNAGPPTGAVFFSLTPLGYIAEEEVISPYRLR